MNNLKVVMYHYVRELKNTRFPGIKGLNLSEFEEQIEYFKNNYNFVTIKDIYDSIYSCKPLIENAIYLTFDDGYIDHYTNVFPILKNNDIEGFFSMPAKILEEREILDVNKIHLILSNTPDDEIRKVLDDRLNHYRGKDYDYPSNENIYQTLTKEKSRFDSDEIIYIKRVLQTYLPKKLRANITDELFDKFVLKKNNISNNVILSELYMTKEQVKLMKKSGMVFGYHGYEHDWLGNMRDEEMIKDFDKAMEFWKNLFGENLQFTCFPYGSYNKNTIKYAKKLGFSIGFSTKRGESILNEDNALILERFDTNDFYPKSRNERI